jgi:lipopolysaccharide/colanic/teichoic acid biosynthesis glycosyltransferase
MADRGAALACTFDRQRARRRSAFTFARCSATALALVSALWVAIPDVSLGRAATGASSGPHATARSAGPAGRHTSWALALPLAVAGVVGAGMVFGLELRRGRPHTRTGVDQGRSRRLAGGFKRGSDIALASLALVVLAPLMALIALAVLADSPGPVLYRGRRVGRGGTQLLILKFRKMRNGANGRPLTLAGDERFTRIGGWLARTRLDELPQLVNVLRGDMSLIGPRPEDPAFVRRHAKAFSEIVQVRPGLTGLAQLAYVAESEILDPADPVNDYEKRILPQKLRLDKLYVTRSSPRLDLCILTWTIAAALLRIPVAVNRVTGQVTVRRGHGGRRRAPPARRGVPDAEALKPEIVAPVEVALKPDILASVEVDD